MKHKWAVDPRGFVLPVFLAAAWEFASHRSAQSAFLIVPLEDIGRAFGTLLASGDLADEVWASFRTALLGLAIGGSIGFVVGALMAQLRSVNVAVSPIYTLLRQIPTMGLVPLVALWFGMDGTAILFLVSLASFEVLVLNSYEGIRAVERNYLDLGRVLTFSRLQNFLRILLPAAFPAILTGILQAVAICWIATVGAELLLGTGPGLGVIMQQAQLNGQMDQVMVCLLAIGVLGFSMNAVFNLIGRRVMRRRSAQ